MREKLAFEFLQALAQRVLAVGEFPVSGQGIDAEHIGGLDHVGALHRVGLAGALQQVAAVEQHRIAGAGFGAQAIDQRFQVGKPAHAAIAMRRFLVVEKREGVRFAGARHHVEIFEERAADDVRRFSAHGADAEVDARLAEIDRGELCVGVGQMQDADIAETADVVGIAVRRQRDARRDAGGSRGGKIAEEFPAIQAQLPAGDARQCHANG